MTKYVFPFGSFIETTQQITLDEIMHILQPLS